MQTSTSSYFKYSAKYDVTFPSWFLDHSQVTRLCTRLWSPYNQMLIALSTLEAKYTALSDTAKESVFIHKLLSLNTSHLTFPISHLSLDVSHFTPLISPRHFPSLISRPSSTPSFHVSHSAPLILLPHLTIDGLLIEPTWNILDYVKNNAKHPRTKYIDTRYYSIRSVYS